MTLGEGIAILPYLLCTPLNPLISCLGVGNSKASLPQGQHPANKIQQNKSSVRAGLWGEGGFLSA